MPRKLKKLSIDRIDLVHAGANQDAHIVLYKSAASVKKQGDSMEDEAPPLTTDERLQQRQLWDQWQPLWSAFCASVWEIMECGEDATQHAPLLMRSIDEFSTRAKDILSGLGLMEKAAPLLAVCDEIQKAGAIMAAGRRKRLQDAIDALQAILDEAAPHDAGAIEKGSRMAERGTVEYRELHDAKERIAMLEGELATAKATLAKAQQTPEEQEAAYMASLPESVRKQREIEKAETAALREELRIEKAAREQQTYIEKTAAYRSLGVTPDHWNVLKAIDAMPEQERTELLRMMASAAIAIKSGNIFKVTGSDGSGNAGGSAQEQVAQLVKTAMQGNDKLTYSDALRTVYKERPDLYRQQRKEAQTHDQD